METDAGNQVDEGLFEADNVAVSAAAFHIDMPPYPDLRVENLAVAGPDASDLYTVTWTTANRGTAPANGGLTERVFIRNATLNTVLTNVEIPFVSDRSPWNGGRFGSTKTTRASTATSRPSAAWGSWTAGGTA